MTSQIAIARNIPAIVPAALRLILYFCQSLCIGHDLRDRVDLILKANLVA